jgi:hypothetical protein
LKLKVVISIFIFSFNSLIENFSINNKLYISLSILSLKSIFDLVFFSHELILYSSNNSFAFEILLAYHLLINELHHLLFCKNISQGTANRSFHKSNAKFAVISVPDFNCASITITQEEIHATISFLTGKL